MDFRKMLEKNPRDRTALIEDGRMISYGELLELAEEKEKMIGRGRTEGASIQPDAFFCSSGKTVCLIEESTILEELAAFFACQGSGRVPVITDGSLTREERMELEKTPVPEEAVIGVLTSGTMGKRKLLFRTYESWADYFTIQNEVFFMGKDTVLFAQGSLAFTGNLNVYLSLFFAGGKMVATKKFYPEYWISVLRAYRVNYMYLVPVKMMALCKAMQTPLYYIEGFVTGSQSFGKKELGKVKAAFPEIRTILYYGSSEASYITYLTEEMMTEDDSLVGIPFPKVKVTIQNGMFSVDSDCGIIGIERPFCTGDFGRVDEQGRFYFLGRQDDILNINGRKCSAYRIEKVIKEELGLSEVLVTVQKRKNRDTLIAYYEGEMKTDSMIQVRRQLGRVLSVWEIPKQFIRVKELPRTDSGKVRRELSLDDTGHPKM